MHPSWRKDLLELVRILNPFSCCWRLLLFVCRFERSKSLVSLSTQLQSAICFPGMLSALPAFSYHPLGVYDLECGYYLLAASPPKLRLYTPTPVRE